MRHRVGRAGLGDVEALVKVLAEREAFRDRALAAVLEHLGFLLYAGPMVAFTILVAVAERIIQIGHDVRRKKAFEAGKLEFVRLRPDGL